MNKPEANLMNKIRITEGQLKPNQVETLLLAYPFSDNKVWRVSELVAWFKNSVELLGKDLNPSSERVAEAMWEQKIRNSLAPSRPYLTQKGLVKKVRTGEYQITAKGLEKSKMLLQKINETRKS